MIDFLVAHCIKDHEAVEKVSVRTAYGVLASVVGIFCNVLLFAMKFIIGLVLHSISVTADAFNNLSDAGSSIISLIGVKLASKPADEEHPFGHGRVEYIAALSVAFLVVQVGFTFFKDAISKIREPEQLRFQMVSIIILLLSIIVKLWLGIFNKKLGTKIDSKVMMATATDALGDVVVTASTILSLIFWKLTGINIDGFVGLAVSLLVIWAGINIAKETLEPLIGEAIAPEVYEQITEFVEHFDGVVGSHDLIVHNYGPGRSMASIHAEVPNDVDIEKSHEIIDRIEREALTYLGMYLVIHMDPIETKNEMVLEVKKRVNQALSEIDEEVSIHDFRLVDGEERMNLIFDMVVPHEYHHEKQEEIKQQLMARLQQINHRYCCVITIEKSFVADVKGEEN
ncbi:cation diffusion facilitator family transporter [Lachnospiraceae bacterium LCP25S3_G4]